MTPPIQAGCAEAEVREATPEEGRSILDLTARRLLGISGHEFLRRWDNGVYENNDDPSISSVAILIPFGR